ncbi:MAG: phenylalanine--tRNA ligase subunit beta [Synergistetes bacterium]|nr:phenylalanine--tRNA ligase subunit beta [Synergistota bacterium]MCX8127384.1 phenylalanine--tRNA ligase subunit beta [Synergistota bacterium]MDW8192248.1 phenylalanine--tRNA ligase subunit beta [Synergistota bacterium]
MKVSFKWLKEFIEINFSPEALAERLLMVGLEVEDIVYLNPGLDGVICATLSGLSRLDDGYIVYLRVKDKTYRAFYKGEAVLIEGKKVAIATVGASIASKLVKSYEVSGLEFDAFLPSEEELRIGEGKGPIFLPDESQEGDTLVRLYELDDVILDISVTPNRGDCLSVIGIAREIAAIKGIGPRGLLPKFDLEEKGRDIRELVSVEVEDYDLCPRYVGRVIEGVKVTESPLWLKRRLIHCGLRPINNVVDATNYVMLELGQPLHAFDLNLIRKRKVIVRRARNGEKIRCIDGVERTLSNNDLVIADAERAIGIAGVIGGENTEIWSGTKDVFLESAFFNPSSIRMTARSLGITTEASYRFERRVDPGNTLFAADRAAYLISKIALGRVSKGYHDLCRDSFKPWFVIMRPERVNRILGTQLKPDEIITIISSLGFSSRYKEDLLEVEVPTYRGDIQREIDLIEEVARIYGYVKVPPRMPWGETQVGGLDEIQKLEWRVRDILIGEGFNEVITYSFIDPEIFDRLLLPQGHPLKECISLLNPLKENQSVMRTFMLPGLISALLFNYRKGSKDIFLFEVGKVFRTELTFEGLPVEINKLGMIMLGGIDKELITGSVIPRDILNLKGALENLFESFKVVADFRDIEEDLPFLVKFRSSSIYILGERVGWIGEISPKISIAFEVNEPIYAAEIDLDRFFTLVPKEIKYKELPRFPSTRRDVSVLVPLDRKAKEVESVIKSIGGEIVEEVRLFDFYQGPQVPQGYRSLTFCVIYRAKDRTLKDEEVEEVHLKVRKELERSGFKVR